MKHGAMWSKRHESFDKYGSFEKNVSFDKNASFDKNVCLSPIPNHLYLWAKIWAFKSLSSMHHPQYLRPLSLYIARNATA